MKRYSCFFFFWAAACSYALAQFTLGTRDHVIELSGQLSGFYNYRFQDPGGNTFDHNRFDLRDAIFQIEGRTRNSFGYELQMDFADLAQNQGAIRDFENPGLMDAFIYKKIKFIELKAGYMKLPYSWQSMVPFFRSPFWQRAEIARGDFFSRRDVGFIAHLDLLQNKIEIDAGIFNGTGEGALRGRNDASGAPEFVGRVFFTWPSRYRYQYFDLVHVPVPVFGLGLNARYTRRDLPQGETFPPGTTGEYGIRMIDGVKQSSSVDFNFQFRGFSLNAEFHRIKSTPFDTATFLFQGTPRSFNKGYFLNGALVLQAQYYLRKWKTGMSARFEDLNINDLAPGATRRLSFAIMWMPRSYASALKIQFTRILKREALADIQYPSFVRAGWQWKF